MRFRSVLGRSPKASAAGPRPSIRHLHRSRTRRMWPRSAPSRFSADEPASESPFRAAAMGANAASRAAPAVHGRRTRLLLDGDDGAVPLGGGERISDDTIQVGVDFRAGRSSRTWRYSPSIGSRIIVFRRRAGETASAPSSRRTSIRTTCWQGLAFASGVRRTTLLTVAVVALLVRATFAAEGDNPWLSPFLVSGRRRASRVRPAGLDRAHSDQSTPRATAPSGGRRR
jgi:hypothetical protein